MPAAVATSPTASARPAPPRPSSAGPETTTRSAPAQLAYLIDPTPKGRSTAHAPQLTTNGTSAYLLEPDPLDERDELDELDAEADSPWPPLLQPEPTLVGRPYVSGSVTAGGAAALPQRPGAYLPPNPVLPPSSVSRPAQLGSSGPPVAVAAAAASSNATAGVASPRPASFPSPIPGGTPPGTPPPGGEPSSPREAFGAAVGSALTSIVERIDRDRVTVIAGWFVVAGSALATLGFLMPWSTVVIGARGTGGYLDDWGLASPTHLFVVIGLLGVLALGVLENPVPAWLRTGVLGLGLGGLLLGLTWPYAIGPLGAQVGAMLTFVGSFALVTGGVIASWSSRHAKVDPVV